MYLFSRHARNLFVLTLAVTLCLPTPFVKADPPPASGTPESHKSAGKDALDATLQEALKNAPTASQFPNSNSMRLLDLGTVTVRSDGTTVGQYRLTYKLFNSNARELAEVRLPYNSSYQDLHVVTARTIKKDGTVVNVNPADIRIGGLAGDYLMYDDAQCVNFSMPAVEDDCIIDYTWEETTHPNLMPGQFMTYWGFSDTMPVGTSRYILKAPADKPLKYKAYNSDKLQPTITTSADGHTKTYTWELKDIKPIEVEPAMPEISEIRSWIEVSSIDTWQSIAEWFHSLQQPQAHANEAIKSTVNSLVANKKTDEEKARAIYDWVTGKTRYVGVEFGISAYKPHAAADVFHNLYGDCKDKANLLITMLGLAGIKAHPVLLHAEDRTSLADRLPTLSAFNHCIALAEVQGKEVWLDATAETCAYGDIPDGDRGVQALVVTDTSGELKTIPSYHSEENGTDIDIAISPLSDGTAHAETTIVMYGEAAQVMRGVARTIPPDKRKQVVQLLAQRFGMDGNVKGFTLPDGQDKEGSYQLKTTMDLSTYGTKESSVLKIPLFSAIVDDKGAAGSNLYTADTRIWPIVNEDTSHVLCRTTLTLPQDYDILALPDDVDLSSPIEEYHRKLTHSADGKSLIITERLVEHPGKVPASDYSKVKTFKTNLVKVSKDEILLKKK